jgi:hypothetical protein
MGNTCGYLKVFICLLIMLIAACAQKRPVLYPNGHLKTVGKAAAESDINECIQLAKDYGAGSNSGQKIATSAAKGAAVGGATGAAVGAVGGNAGRGAAAGAAGGAAGSATRAVLRSGDPDPVFRRFVEKCLRDKGYEPIGWK